MAYVDPVRSLLEFNRRVLDQGTPQANGIYSRSDLHSMLFFNIVFGNNMNEMFQKYDMTQYEEEYAEMMKIRESTITWIINQFCMDKWHTTVSTSDTFEERLMGYQFINDIVARRFAKSPDLNMTEKLRDDTIYYACIWNETSVLVWHVDHRAGCYKHPLGIIDNGDRIYWKTDQVIRDVGQHMYGGPAVAFIVTKSKKDGSIVKISYNGSKTVIDAIVGMINNYCYTISDPYLYTDDIEKMFPVPSKPQVNPEEPRRMITFGNVWKSDQLLEYPVDSFDNYLGLLRAAALTPSVKAIYLTLYRIGRDPSIYYILRDAVRNGKKVFVNIETKASGEAINTLWIPEMKEAGIDVKNYMFGRYKVHCKLTLFEFSDGRFVTQIGTGNYHTVTTRQYTDLSYITADQDIGNEVRKLFRVLNGEDIRDFSYDVLVTRYNARKRIIELIDMEAAKGPEGYIAIKCNAIDDPEIIRHLDTAADKGCRMDLIVRGMCAFIPKSIDKTVTIRSIVWDKLEHSRVFMFGRVDPNVFIGSLDLVTHKIDGRIETMIRVNDPDVVLKIVNYLNRYICNTKESWILTKSGIYRKEYKHGCIDIQPF